MELILDEVSSTDMEFREILSILPLLLLSTSRLSFRPADGARVETGIEIKKKGTLSPRDSFVFVLPTYETIGVTAKSTRQQMYRTRLGLVRYPNHELSRNLSPVRYP